MRTLVIGAGPIGIEAALAATERGHEVTVVERDIVGASLRSWGRTRFFSPFSMNASARLKRVLGADAPGEDALLTGPEMVERVLEPVADRGPLEGRVRTRTTVVAVGRHRMTRRDRPGHPTRHRRPFVALVDHDGVESHVEADLVLDASGVGRPLAFGIGGVPAPGERRASGRVIHTLGELEARWAELTDRRLLVIGHGHSAACALERLAAMTEAAPETSVTWAVRSISRHPVVAIATDPLPERARIVEQANTLAHAPPSWLTVERKAHVERVEDGADEVVVTLSGNRRAAYDAILAFTGAQPDLSFLGELQVRISPVSQGADGIYRALSNVTDCLSVPSLSPRDLESGEPGFYLVGAKSYGRMSTFLLRNGVEQLETILDREGGRR